MWNINSPKSMESGCGRKEYCSGGMASATATDNLLRAAKCLEYSPAAPRGAAAASAAKSKTGTSKTRVTTARDFIPPPGKFMCCDAHDRLVSQVLFARLLARRRDSALETHVDHGIPVMLPGVARM